MDYSVSKTKPKIKERKKLNRNTTIIGFLFLLPAVVFISFATVIPTIWNIVLSFQNWNGFQEAQWVGFENYIRAFQDTHVRNSLYNSFFLGIISTIGSVVIGLLLAALLYNLGKIEGAIYRLILFVPAMMPLAIIGLLFTFLLNPQMGLINQFLGLVGLESLQKAWLSNPDTVLWVIAIVGMWRLAGITMMLCFASMLSIPKTLFESCELDGGGYIRQFFSIIFPLIKPIVLLSTVFTLITQLKTYDLVYVMTRGGPGTESTTVPIYMVETAFSYSEFGYSATIGMIFVVASLILIMVTSKILKGEQHEY